MPNDDEMMYVCVDTWARRHVGAWARGCVTLCVHFCRYIESELIFQLILFTGMGVLLQINDTKQPDGVSFCEVKP